MTIGTASPTSWAYDDNGNRTKSTDPSSNVTNYNYTTGTNILANLSGHVAQTFTTDASGNMTGDGTNTWTYDQRGRMATQVASSVTTTYLINELGLRVKKSNTGNTNYYAYDELGHVLGEYDSSGNPLKETAYIGDLPVGVLSKSGATYTEYSLLPDWIGAPHIIANSSGTFAWTWDHLAWGDNAPNQNPGGLGTFVYDWRFPGQVYDSESSLFYNISRDYSSTLAQYIESDPIGLNGGSFSTYAYVGGNPLNFVDPQGLAICLYSITNHTLACMSISGGPIYVLGPVGVWSGVGSCANNPSCSDNSFLGPIPAGQYKMNEDNRPGHQGFWRLEPEPQVTWWQYYTGQKRNGFELHLGEVSLGCITGDKNNPDTVKYYQNINQLLQGENGDNTLTVVQ